MSSGDGGGNFFNSLSGEGDFFENLLTDVANIGAQSITGGFAGVGKDGLKTGVTSDGIVAGGKAAVKGLKDVTGATAAEQANALAREQFEKSQADILNQRNENIKQVGRDQVKQSMLAGSARNAGKTSGSFSLGGDERDFLGL